MAGVSRGAWQEKGALNWMGMRRQKHHQAAEWGPVSWWPHIKGRQPRSLPRGAAIVLQRPGMATVPREGHFGPSASS